MKDLRKILAVVLVMIMCIGLMPVRSLAIDNSINQPTPNDPPNDPPNGGTVIIDPNQPYTPPNPYNPGNDPTNPNDPGNDPTNPNDPTHGDPTVSDDPNNQDNQDQDKSDEDDPWQYPDEYYYFGDDNDQNTDKKEDKKEENKKEEDKKEEDKKDEKADGEAEEIILKIILTVGSKDLEKYLNEVKSIIKMDIAPYIKDGRTMIPIRYLAEALEMKVTWDEKTRTVLLEDDKFKIEIPVDTNKIIVNGEETESDVKPEIKMGRTNLPIANIARALGLKDGEDILWDPVEKKATIIRKLQGKKEN